MAPPGRGSRQGERPVGSLILRVVREFRGLEPEEVAETCGLSGATIRYLELGKGGEPSMVTVEKILKGLGVSLETFEELRVIGEGVRKKEMEDRWVGPVLIEGEQLQRAVDHSRRIGGLTEETSLEFQLSGAVRERVAEDRERAAQLGELLREREQLVDLVRRDSSFHLWSVSEWLCDESLNTIAKDRKRAGECAEAAVVVAELAPMEAGFRSRLTGYCLGHVGNVRRAFAKLSPADLAFGKCAELWRLGAGSDPFQLLDAGRLMGMEASLRRAQGRFDDAMALLMEAMPVASQKIRPYLRISYGRLLDLTGHSEQALRVLAEGEAPPLRLLFYSEITKGTALCHLGRFEEVEDLLPRLKGLAIRTESEDNTRRVRWLAGRLAIGRGRLDEALVCFRQLQGEFLALGNSFDAALASLDITKIHLLRGETDTTLRRLLREMASVFTDPRLHPNVREALEVFRDAVARATASVDFIELVILYLLRAREAPALRFDQPRE